jgi:hypothetical protein
MSMHDARAAPGLAHAHLRAAGLRTEFLVVLALLVVLAGLLLPAVQKVRASAARARCGNNVRRLCLGLHACNDAQGRLPPQAGTFAKASPGPLFYHLLPYVGESGLYRSATAGGSVCPAWNTPGQGGGFLRQTRVAVYQCPADPSLGHCLDWCDGDASYAGNFQVFGGAANAAGGRAWDGGAQVPTSFPDGTSNTIVLAEKYARCDGGGSPGGTWWMRGVYDYAGVSGGDDSYPGDRMSAVFGGGVGIDGTAWLTGPGSKFLVRPDDFLRSPGPCDKRLASSPHPAGMTVGMADGSARFVSAALDAGLWWKALVPDDGPGIGE